MEINKPFHSHRNVAELLAAGQTFTAQVSGTEILSSAAVTRSLVKLHIHNTTFTTVFKMPKVYACLELYQWHSNRVYRLCNAHRPSTVGPKICQSSFFRTRAPNHPRTVFMSIHF